MLAAFCISGHKRHPAVTSSMNRMKENDDYIFLFPGRKFRKPPTVPFILLSKKFLQTIKIKGLIWWMGGKSLLSHDFKILYLYNPLNIGFLVFYLSRKRIHLNKITFEPNLGKGVLSCPGPGWQLEAACSFSLCPAAAAWEMLGLLESWLLALIQLHPKVSSEWVRAQDM